MKKTFGFILVFLLTFPILTIPIFGEVAGSFPDIKYPSEFFIEGDRIYINEGTAISIYSLKDFKQIKKFGKKGEGPQEFKLNQGNTGVQLFVHDDCLQVNSIGRMSFFSKDGEFLRVQRSLEGNFLYIVGKNYVGWKRVYHEKIRYDTVNIYNKNLERIKELYRQRNGIQPSLKRINTLTWFIDSLHRGYKNKIYICTLEGELMVFNDEGKKLSSVKLPLEPVEVSESAKKKIMRFYSHEDPYFKIRYERLKSWYRTPDTFPPVRYLYISDDLIYVLTYLEKGDTTQCVIFDLKGKPVKKAFIPLVKETYVFFKPFMFKNNTLYQMVENEDTDDWELRVYEIK